MDEVSVTNRVRWDELSRCGVQFSRPWLDLTPETAMARVNPEGMPVEVEGRDVLCLVASGGQQSAAFGVLGARVTIYDLSDEQLAKDEAAAAHYQYPVRTVQGDMRDLATFDDGSFDLVWHAHGINFVPDAAAALREACRVLRPGGWYHIQLTNPWAHAVWDRWNGSGFEVRDPFVEGGEMEAGVWKVTSREGEAAEVPGPREFRHSLGHVINTMIGCGLRLTGLWEDGGCAPSASHKPGSWEHFISCVPPWVTIWARLET